MLSELGSKPRRPPGSGTQHGLIITCCGAEQQNALEKNLMDGKLLGRVECFSSHTAGCWKGLPSFIETQQPVLYNEGYYWSLAVFGEPERVNPPMEHSPESTPLEFFLLGRRIRQGLTRCAKDAAAKSGGDVFYLWLQTETLEDAPPLTADQWLNIVDEAASLGVNWLVVTLGPNKQEKGEVAELCRWAQATHGMVVCLHARYGEIGPAERQLLLELPRESTFLLVEPEQSAHFADLAAQGVCVGSANPLSNDGDRDPCDFPHRMIFVDAQGRLYTCGLVSGENEFFLGSVLNESLDTIIHNPKLPHTVSVPAPASHSGCSGCPPLVAKHLCHK